MQGNKQPQAATRQKARSDGGRRRQALRRAQHTELTVSERMKALREAAARRIDDRDFAALERLVWDSSDQIRGFAAMLLATCGSRDALETMRRLLHHRDHVVRMNAVHGLGLAREDEDEDRLLKVLLDRQEDPRVRAEAAEVLGGFSSTATAAALKRTLNDPSPLVRYFSIHALSQSRAFDATRTIERRRNDRGWTEFGTVGSKAREVSQDLRLRKMPGRRKRSG